MPPSKRHSPPPVPIHTAPSEACRTANTLLSARPSSGVSEETVPPSYRTAPSCSVPNHNTPEASTITDRMRCVGMPRSTVEKCRPSYRLTPRFVANQSVPEASSAMP